MIIYTKLERVAIEDSAKSATLVGWNLEVFFVAMWRISEEVEEKVQHLSLS